MKRIQPKYLLLLLSIISGINVNAQVMRKRTLMLMGSRCEITIVAEEKEKAERYIDTVIAEITRIENLISDWKPETQISQVNRSAGIAPVKVDREVLELTERALNFSEITNGAFDISFAAMERIWKFDGSMTEMPSPETVKKSVEKVGYKNIIVDREKSTIFLKEKGMKIGFGALGEGYAADRCKMLMMQKGVKAGIINGSGDMNTWGSQPNGKPWMVAITNPLDRDNDFKPFPLKLPAIVTSGSYEKLAMINGIRYSHIINPKTGYPASGLCSVTVMGESAEKANAFSTSVMVLGKDAGLALINKYPELKCIVVTDEGKIYASKNTVLKKYTKKQH